MHYFQGKTIRRIGMESAVNIWHLNANSKFIYKLYSIPGKNDKEIFLKK